MLLEAHLAMPSQSGRAPGVILFHGFPSGVIAASHIGNDLPQLADRIASEMGWVALTVRLRGCGESTGNFSMSRWLTDAEAAVAYLRDIQELERIWLVGFGTGGALAITVGADDRADDEVIAGVAVIGTPADFSDWAKQPSELLGHARRSGAIRDPEFPEDLESWGSEIRSLNPAKAAERLTVPLLVLHGSDDERVPAFDARMVADAHGAADLRLISGAGHQLRHDPRAIAILLGWLERQRNA